MPFTGLDFAIFFSFVLFFNWRLRTKVKIYPIFILLASFIFYGLGAPKFLPLLLAVGLATWFASKLMTPDRPYGQRRLILIIDIIVCLGLLSFFKYFEFLLTSLESLGLAGPLESLFKLPEIVYPVGLSFFTFQGLSLVIDRFRRPDYEAPSLLNTLSFVSFFPTVLSGPIQRWNNFEAQLNLKEPSKTDFNLALVLILSGLFKKVAMSSYLSEQIVRGVFQVPDSYSALGVLAGVYGYSAQIYLDFSGYSDLAQGVGLLLGFDVGRNFNSPYLASNMRDFWRRWHISLSSWLRDYLYIPLGGSRRGSKTLNLLITQTLGGLWHGAHLRYLVWGFFHGIALALTHLVKDRIPNGEPCSGESVDQKWYKNEAFITGLKKWGGFILTFNFVSFMWILFRAESFDRALEVAGGVFDFSRVGHGAPLMVWILTLLAIAGQKIGRKVKDLMLNLQAKMNAPALSLWCAFWVIIIVKLGPDGILPFIYFQY
jgi:D-alanyl-lipoteichoic acid acyltransferase DltB (MBOAT superfamily)